MAKLGDDHPLRREASRDKIHRRSLTAILSVVLPLILALLGTVTSSLWDSYHGLVLIPWVLLLTIHTGVWICAYTDNSSVISLSVENSDLLSEVGELQTKLDDAEKWVFHSYAAMVLRDMTAGYVINGVDNKEAFGEAIDELLSPLYLSGGEVFKFTPSERWTFGVFIYVNDKDELVPVWREKSRNHPSSGDGRSWGRGQGHVGKAFVDRKPIITGDAEHPDVVQLCGAPAGLEKPYDLEVYRSFASIPIGPIGDGGNPYGVLVGTSDQKDRFDQDSAILLMHYADSIAVMIALGNIDVNCILTGSTPYVKERENHNGKGNPGKVDRTKSGN